MAPVSIFVWRVRICLLAVALGLMLADERGTTGAKQESMHLTTGQVPCPMLPARDFVAVQTASSDIQDEPCADPAMARTPDGKKPRSDRRVFNVSLRGVSLAGAIPTPRTPVRERAAASLANRRGPESSRTQVE